MRSALGTFDIYPASSLQEFEFAHLFLHYTVLTTAGNRIARQSPLLLFVFLFIFCFVVYFAFKFCGFAVFCLFGAISI